MQTTLLNKEYLRDRYEYWMRGKQEYGSNLYNEKTFFRYFIKDALEAKKEVIIYSPFVSKYRTDYLKRTIEKLRQKNIEVFIFTRPVESYESMFRKQIQCALDRYEEMGVCVFFLPGFIHEKVAIIDREILWEGSLNILSQKASREIMRRTADESTAMQIISYLSLGKKLAEGYRVRYEKLCRNLVTDSRQYIRAKIQIFMLGLIIPVVIWLFISCLRDIISSQFIKLITTLLLSH